MLGWRYLRPGQRLIGVVALLLVLGLLVGVATYPGLLFGARIATLAAPVLMLGMVLHPALLTGSRALIEWSRTPFPCRMLYLLAGVCFVYGWGSRLLG